MGMLGPFIARAETDDIEFAVISAEHAPELKILVDAEIARKLALMATARLVAFDVSGGGNGAKFMCTLCYVNADPGEFPGVGIALTQISSHFFEAGRGVETQAQLVRFLVANPSGSVAALSEAGGGAGAVFMTALIFDSQVAAQVRSYNSGTAVLVAGVVTVATPVADTLDIWVQLILHGGTAGTRYLVDTIVPGNPGSFDITAVDTAGATVATDTSSLRWFMINAEIF